MRRRIINIVFVVGLILADVVEFLSPKPMLGLIMLAAMLTLYFLMVFGPRFFLKSSGLNLSKADIDGILEGGNINFLFRDLFFRRSRPSGSFFEGGLPPKKKISKK